MTAIHELLIRDHVGQLIRDAARSNRATRTRRARHARRAA